MYKVAVKIPIEYFKNNCVPWEFNRGSENFCTKIYSAKFRDAKYGTDQLRIFKKNRMKKKIMVLQNMTERKSCATFLCKIG